MHEIRFFVFRKNPLASRVLATFCCCTCSNSLTTNPAVQPTSALKVQFMTSVAYVISSGHVRSRQTYVCIIPTEYKQLRTLNLERLTFSHNFNVTILQTFYNYNFMVVNFMYSRNLIFYGCQLYVFQKFNILWLSTLCILEI